MSVCSGPIGFAVERVFAGRYADFRPGQVVRLAPVFEKLATLWRKKHAVEVALLSRAGITDKIEALSQFNETEKRLGGRSAYMKAKAEGKTKLEYEQWVQVRTPNFKRWWGYDWEVVNEKGNLVRPGTSATEQGDPGNQNAIVNGRREDGNGVPEIQTRLGGHFFVHPDTGEPRVFYHGTQDEFTEFDVRHPNKKDQGWLGRGHYVTSDEWIAETYSRMKRGNADPRVMQLFVRPTNPLLMVPENKRQVARYTPEQLDRFTQRLKDNNYRGSMVMWNDGMIEMAAFDANSIKSATDNVGTFSESNDIRFSRYVAPAPTSAKTADDIINQKAGTSAPIDYLTRKAVQAVGLDKLTTGAYNKAGFLLDRYTPETIKAGMVSDYGIPESVLDQRAIMQGRQRQQIRAAGALLEKLATLTRAESRVAYQWMNADDPQSSDYFLDQLPPESIKTLSVGGEDLEEMLANLVASEVRHGKPRKDKRNNVYRPNQTRARRLLPGPCQERARRKGLQNLQQ